MCTNNKDMQDKYTNIKTNIYRLEHALIIWFMSTWTHTRTHEKRHTAQTHKCKQTRDTKLWITNDGVQYWEELYFSFRKVVNTDHVGPWQAYAVNLYQFV